MRKVLARIPYASIATVSPEGHPWNTPVFIAVDEAGRFYWCSLTSAQHSRNVAQHSLVSIVIYDSGRRDQSGAGVYVQAACAELNEAAEIQHGLDRIYARRKETPPPADQFMADHPRRVYRATPVLAWTNVVTTEHGYPADERVPIDLSTINSSSG